MVQVSVPKLVWGTLKEGGSCCTHASERQRVAVAGCVGEPGASLGPRIHFCFIVFRVILFKRFIYFCFACMSEHLHVYMFSNCGPDAYGDQKRSLAPPRTGILGGCELSDVGARN